MHAMEVMIGYLYGIRYIGRNLSTVRTCIPYLILYTWYRYLVRMQEKTTRTNGVQFESMCFSSMSWSPTRTCGLVLWLSAAAAVAPSKRLLVAYVERGGVGGRQHLERKQRHVHDSWGMMQVRH